jgi:hypothetical protein
MGFIAIYCPRTGREVSTGVESDREAFQKLRPVVTRMKCPACGSEHVWSKATARVVELPVAASARATKSHPPPAPMRSRPAAAAKAAKPVAPPPAQPAIAKRGNTLTIANRLLDRR